VYRVGDAAANTTAVIYKRVLGCKRQKNAGKKMTSPPANEVSIERLQATPPDLTIAAWLANVLKTRAIGAAG
jgi:hypothetical protein